MLKLFKRFFCSHKNKIAVKEDWSYFGPEYVAIICADCGKKLR